MIEAVVVVYLCIVSAEEVVLRRLLFLLLQWPDPGGGQKLLSSLFCRFVVRRQQRWNRGRRTGERVWTGGGGLREVAGRVVDAARVVVPGADIPVWFVTPGCLGLLCGIGKVRPLSGRLVQLLYRGSLLLGFR